MTTGIIKDRPGVYGLERPFQVVPSSPDTSIGMFVGEAERGPLDVPLRLTGFQQFELRYGSRIAGGQLYDEVWRFFQQGGSVCWVLRVSGSGADVATIDVPNHDGNDALTVSAENAGAWGNRLSVKPFRYSTTLAVALVGPGPHASATLASVANVRPGDVLRITAANGDTGEDVVFAVNPTTKVVTFAGTLAISGAGAAGIGAVCDSASSHRAVTTLAVAALATDTEITVTNSNGFRAGSRVVLAKSTAYESHLVNSVSGNTLFLATALGAGYSVGTGSAVASVEFDLDILLDGVRLDTRRFLSMESVSVDYVNKRLGSASSESYWINVVDAAGAAADPVLEYPAPGEVFLAGGSDDAALTVNWQEAITTDRLLDKATDMFYFTLVEPPSVVLFGEADTYAEAIRGDVFQFIAAPEDQDMPDEILSWRTQTLGIDSSYSGLFYPRALVPAPEPGTSHQVVRPLTGWAQGKYSSINRQVGPWRAAANDAGRLTGIEDLTHRIDRENHGLLNGNGINVTVFERNAFRIMGARTLWSQEDGKEQIPVRLTLNYIKRGLRDALAFALFLPNQPSVWRRIQAAAEAFITPIWENGGLYPDDDATQAFDVRFDRTTMTETDIRSKRVRGLIRVNVTDMIEQVIFEIDRLPGSMTVTERTGQLAA